MAQLVIVGPKGRYNKTHGGHQTIITSDGCGYETRRLSNLARHKKSMHERNIQNLTCGFRYQNKAEFKDHRKAVHSKGYKCPDCSKVFSRRALLHRHFSIHTGIREFRCHLCDYESSHKSNLQHHINSRHKVEVPKFMTPDSTCCNYHPLTEPKISHSIALFLDLADTAKTTIKIWPLLDPKVKMRSRPRRLPIFWAITDDHRQKYCGFGEVNSLSVGNYYFNNGGWNYNEENSTAGITTNFSRNPNDQANHVPNYVHKKWRVVKSRFFKLTYDGVMKNVNWCNYQFNVRL